MERSDQKPVRVTALRLSVEDLPPVFLVGVGASKKAKQRRGAAASSSAVEPRVRKKVLLDEELTSRFRSRVYLRQRNVPDCFEEALVGWLKSSGKPAGRSAAHSPAEGINDKPCVYVQVNPALWAAFKSRATELRRGCSECVELALRAWLAKN